MQQNLVDEKKPFPHLLYFDIALYVIFEITNL